MTAPASLLVVVVTRNSARTIGPCLRSLERALAGLQPRASADVVVVDSASTDGTPAAVMALAPAQLLRLGMNAGFAGAVHAGVRCRHGWTHLLLANPDVEVEAGCVAALLDAALRVPGAGIYGGLSLRPDGAVDPTCCLAAPSLWQATCFALGTSHLLRGSRRWDPDSIGGFARDRARHVPALTAGLLLIAAATWRSLGGLDRRYVVYGEDVDLCLRAAARGWRPYFTPAARYVHAGGASSSPVGREVRILAGKVTLYRRHLGPLRARLAVAALHAGVLLRAAGGRRGQRGARARTWAGVWARRGEWRHGW